MIQDNITRISFHHSNINNKINNNHNHNSHNHQYSNHINNTTTQPQQVAPIITTPYAQPNLAPLKVMIFIDGTWLYYSIYEREHSRDVIAQKLGRGWQRKFQVDWSRLPTVACQALLQDKKSSWSSIMPMMLDPNIHHNTMDTQPQQSTITDTTITIKTYRSITSIGIHIDAQYDERRFLSVQNVCRYDEGRIRCQYERNYWKRRKVCRYTIGC